MRYEPIKGKRGGFLHVSDEEYEKIKPLLNRYGFLDRFPQEDYPGGYPELVDVFMWMFPESIKVVSTVESKELRTNRK